MHTIIINKPLKNMHHIQYGWSIKLYTSFFVILQFISKYLNQYLNCASFFVLLQVKSVLNVELFAYLNM